MKTIHLLPALLFFLPFFGFAQTNTWTGASNSAWGNQDNWSLGTVPTANHHVVIEAADNQPTIFIGSPTIKSLYIHPSAELNISPTRTLTVRGGVAVGVENHGKLWVAGNLLIGTDALEYGIRNFGDVSVKGTIRIERCSVYGVDNQSDSFLLENTLTVDCTQGDVGGIHNLAYFQNQGWLEIKRAVSKGIYNADGIFDNAGEIRIGTVAGATPGEGGLINLATFNNLAEGVLYIDRTTEVALSSDVLINKGKIFIGSAGSAGKKGIEAAGLAFENRAGGEIHVNNVSQTGMSAVLVTNEGFIAIGPATGTIGLLVIQSLVNAPCGAIELNNVFKNEGSFTNNGSLRVNTATAHPALNFPNAQTNNNGIIEYPMGNPIPGILNTGLIVQPVAGNCIIANALQKGPGSQVETGTVWHKDESLSQAAGDYDAASNTFTPGDLVSGAHTLYFSATANGCTYTLPVKVSFTDAAKPSIDCPDNQIVPVGSDCQALLGSWSPVSVSDNCTINPTVTQMPAPAMLLASVGSQQTVTLTADDRHGNISTCTFMVTAADLSAPLVSCKNAAVDLTAAGSSVISTASIFQAGADDCGAVNIVSVVPNVFDCSHLGEHVVVLTANDGHGNTATCMATVTVSDKTNPVAVCKNTTLALSAAGTVNIDPASLLLGSSDNCSGVNIVSVWPNHFSCNNLGENNVVLTVADASGNQGVCYSLVTVVDNTAPAVVCKDVTINLNAAGSTGITPASVFLSGSDNCGGVSAQSVFPNQFSCNNLGNNMVSLTVSDSHGNTATCTATVTVRDLIAPNAQCKNTTVHLGANGSVTVAASAMNNGSSDNCAIASMSLSAATFNCANAGANIVVLTIGDAAGNTASCNAVITVKDQQAPTAMCKNVTLYLNSQGQATLTPSAVNNGSTDNCGIATISLSQTNFTCANLSGSNVAVALTVKDASNNTASCVAQVTVRDQTAPQAICESTTIQLNAQGKATVYSTDLTGESIDNCNIAASTPTLKNFTAANLGVNNLTITVKDWSNNASTCTAQITVLPYGGAEQAGTEARMSELPAGTSTLRLYPNPASGYANVEFQLAEDTGVELRVFDLNGQLMSNSSLDGMAGDNRVPVDLTSAPAGVYIVEIQANKWREQKRLVVRRD